MLWSRGIARAAMMGAERTHNPSPAAASMIGKKQLARAEKVYYSVRSSRRAYKGNPLPALLLALAPKLGLSLPGSGPDAAKQKLRIAKLDDLAYQVVNVKGAAGASALNELQAISQRMEGHGVAINDEIVNHARELLTAIGKAATPPGKTPLQQAGAFLQTPGGANLALGLAKGAQQKPRYNKYGQLTERVFNGYNPRTGKPSYKNVVSQAGSAAGYAAPAGLGGVAGGASFLGTVGAGGAALTAAQLATAGAAGVGAYYLTNLLLKHLGGKSISAQKAGVQAAIDHRDALTRYPQEKDAINAAYFSTLQQLGYDPQTFTRNQSFLERITGDYFTE